jgi:hypothetical protein
VTFRRRLAGALVAAVLGSLPLLLVVIFRPGHGALALDVYLLYLGGVLLLALVQATREAQPLDPHSAFSRELARRRPRERERLKELTRQEREVALSMDAAYDLHVRLRPTLRLVAAHRLAARRNIDLDAQPDRARTVLGEEAWDLVRPDREPPEDRFARGVSLEQLSTVVDALERI